ncbi:MAG: type II toxin-antitoxin system Phd/YefM family antitoxin [Candidatus Dormibacteraceae bacterium]
MINIGLRYLNHHTTAVVSRVRNGETIRVTDRGMPILRLVPEGAAAGDLRAKLIACGDLIPAEDSTPFPEPAPAKDGGESLSETLAAIRNEERY